MVSIGFAYRRGGTVGRWGLVCHWLCQCLGELGLYADVVEPFGGGTNQLRQLLIDDSQRVKTGARSLEIRGPLAKSSFQGVGVDIVD